MTKTLTIKRRAALTSHTEQMTTNRRTLERRHADLRREILSIQQQSEQLNTQYEHASYEALPTTDELWNALTELQVRMNAIWSTFVQVGDELKAAMHEDETAQRVAKRTLQAVA